MLSFTGIGSPLFSSLGSAYEHFDTIHRRRPGSPVRAPRLCAAGLLSGAAAYGGRVACGGLRGRWVSLVARRTRAVAALGPGWFAATGGTAARRGRAGLVLRSRLHADCLGKR